MMTKDESTLKSRKTLVERLLNRNFKRRQQQLSKLDSLRGGSARAADILAYNPAYGLEEEDPRLEVVGKVAGSTSKELSYNYDDFAKDYETFDSDKQVDEDIKHERAQNKEVFRKILLPGLGKTLKNKSTFNLIEKHRSDGSLDSLSEKPETLSLKTDSTHSSKLSELCKELEAEIEFDQTWSNFTENNKSSKAVDNLFAAEEVTEKEQDNSSILSKSYLNVSEPINVRKLSGNDYLEVLLSDELDNLTFITSTNSKKELSPKTQLSSKSSKSVKAEVEYNFGKTYDFGTAVRPFEQKFDNHSQLQKKIDAEFEEREDMESLAELQNLSEKQEQNKGKEEEEEEEEEVTIVSEKPEVNTSHSILLCEPENVDSFSFEQEENGEREKFQEGLLKSVEAIEPVSDSEKEEELLALETRLRDLQKLEPERQETESEVLPEKCVEVVTVDLNNIKNTNNSNNSKNTKLSNKSGKSARSNGNILTRLFGRTKENKSQKTRKDSGSKFDKNTSGRSQVVKKSDGERFESELKLGKEDYDLSEIDFEKEEEEGSEYGSVKPWNVKLDELNFYASRNLRNNLVKNRKVSKVESDKNI